MTDGKALPSNLLGSPLCYGERVRLFATSDEVTRATQTGSNNNNDQSSTTTAGYVTAYCAGTQLPPMLTIQSSAAAQPMGLGLQKPYDDLMQSIYFILLDPHDMKPKLKKPVKFNDAFIIIPYNATTGEEFVDFTINAISPLPLRQTIFTFRQSPQLPAHHNFSNVALLEQMMAQQNVDLIIRKNINNVLLNVVQGKSCLSSSAKDAAVSPTKKGKEGPSFTEAIMFSKDRIAGPGHGCLMVQKENLEGFELSAAMKNKPTNRDDITLRPVRFTIKPADEPLLTLSLYEKPGASSSTTGAEKTTSPKASKNHGKLIKTVHIHSLGQYYTLFDGYDKEYDDAVLSVQFRDVGKKSIETSQLPPIPLFVPKQATIDRKAAAAAATTNIGLKRTNSDVDDDNNNNNEEEEQEKSEADKHSVLRHIELHGNQVSMDVPIKFNRIATTPSPAQQQALKDEKEKILKQLKKEPHFLLSLVVLVGLILTFYQGGLQQQLLNLNNNADPMSGYLHIALLTIPSFLIAFLLLQYPILAASPTYPKAYTALCAKEKQNHSSVIIQIGAPVEVEARDVLLLANVTPAPFVIHNQEYNVGFGSIEELVAKTKNNANVNTTTAELTAAQESNGSDKDKVVDLEAMALENKADAAKLKELLAKNVFYAHAIRVQQHLSAVSASHLTLFKELDVLRSAALITHMNFNNLPFTLSTNAVGSVEKMINGWENSAKLKQAIKQIDPNTNITAECLQILQQFDQPITFNMASPVQQFNITTEQKEKKFFDNYKEECVEVTLHYPFLFKAIRESHGLTTEDMVNAWSFDLTRLPQSALGAGRSGSSFMTSSCGKYIYKSLNGMDVSTLHFIMKDYCAYITTKPSCLMRIFGCYEVKSGKDSKFFLIANNVFYLPPPLNKDYTLATRYDLKGRTPKLSVEKRRTEADSGVFKDLQLARVFELEPTAREQIVQNLMNDAQWLMEQGCIDYSLLVGVAENNEFSLSLDDEVNKDQPFVTNIVIENNTAQHAVVGVPPFIKAKDSYAELFQVSIVDFLARYDTFVKKTAHALKSLRWKDEELSTVHNNIYGARLKEYVCAIFPPGNSLIVRTKAELEQHFLKEQSLALNQPPESPTVQGAVEKLFKSLPENAQDALLEGSRSPGTYFFDSSGRQITIKPLGVATAPRGIVERSMIKAPNRSVIFSNTGNQLNTGPMAEDA